MQVKLLTAAAQLIIEPPASAVPATLCVKLMAATACKLILGQDAFAHKRTRLLDQPWLDAPVVTVRFAALIY